MNESTLQNFLLEKEYVLNEKLKAFFQLPIHPDIASAEVEIFLDDESGDEASFWIYFDGKNKKIDKNDESLFPGRSMQLIELNFFDEDLYDNAHSDSILEDLDSLADSLKNWFVECWNRSGGQSYPIPVEVGVHDGFGDGRILKISK